MSSELIITRLRDNWKSGLAVALINIPLSISLAVASLGADSASAPLVGILTAIWGGMIASIFASSHHNIFGPAGALSGILIVFSLTVGAQYVPFVAVLAGLIILAMWGLRVAKYITLIPTSVLHGFLLAVAVTIGATQLN
jgi:sulfate permease, SulP family